MRDRSEAIHAPTPQRLERARREGQIVRSRDLIWAGVWITCVSSIAWLSPALIDRWNNTVTNSWSGNVVETQPLELWQSMSSLLYSMMPVLLLILGGAIAFNLIQGGWGFFPGRVQPQLSRLKKESSGFSIEGFLKATSTMFKIACLFSVTGLFLYWNREELAMLGAQNVALTFNAGLELILAFSLQVAIVLACFGMIDYGISRLQFQNGLKMSDQELRDEQRQLDGDPRVQSARSVIHRERMASQQTANFHDVDFVIVDGRSAAFGMAWIDEESQTAKLVWAVRGVKAVIAINQAASHNVTIRRDVELAEKIAAEDAGAVIEMPNHQNA